MRLEQENDDLAHELVTSKIALRNDLDQVSLVSRGRNKTGDVLQGKDQVTLRAVPPGLALCLMRVSCLMGEWVGGMRESGRWEGTVVFLADGEKHKPLGFRSFSNSVCKILKKKKKKKKL